MPQVPAVEPDGPVLTVQPLQIDWMQAMLVHTARLLQGCKLPRPFMTLSVLATCFWPLGAAEVSASCFCDLALPTACHCTQDGWAQGTAAISPCVN